MAFGIVSVFRCTQTHTLGFRSVSPLFAALTTGVLSLWSSQLARSTMPLKDTRALPSRNTHTHTGGVGVRRHAGGQAHDPRDPATETVRPRQHHPHRGHDASSQRGEVQGRLHGARQDGHGKMTLGAREIIPWRVGLWESISRLLDDFSLCW